MPKIRNISPLGDLEIPDLRLVVRAGEVIDVTEDQAARLLDQPTNYKAEEADE